MTSLREAWDEHAAQWLAWARTPGHDQWFWRWNWPAFAVLLPPPGRATLDLGCGEGRCGRLLAKLGHRVTGVDGSPTLAAAARDAGGYHEVLLADLAALPLPDGAFDLACAFMSLHDVDDLDGALREARRVLAPEGVLAAAIYHPSASAAMGQGPPDVPHRWSATATHAGLEMPFHSMHRPLDQVLDAIRDAGFALDGVHEPAPPDDLGPTPLFLHLVARPRAPSAPRR